MRRIQPETIKKRWNAVLVMSRRKKKRSRYKGSTQHAKLSRDRAKQREIDAESVTRQVAEEIFPEKLALVRKTGARLANLTPAANANSTSWVTTAIAAILCLVQMLMIAYIPDRVNFTPLPQRIRIDRLDLASLPVKLGTVQSCGCWDGLHGQAQKKFKFSVENTSAGSINIGGGEQSSVRLLVAYRQDFTPVQTLAYSDETEYAHVATPSDVGMWLATRTETVEPMELEFAPDTFPVPKGFRLWGLVPSSNYVVEPVTTEGDPMTTFGTVIDQAILDRGQRYSSDLVGHGSWVFPLPLPEDLRILLYPGFEIPASVINTIVVVLGVATFSGREGGRLTGFAAAPPHGMLSAPWVF